MTNEEKAKAIYLKLLVDHNGWEKEDALQALEDCEYDSFYIEILDILEQ